MTFELDERRPRAGVFVSAGRIHRRHRARGRNDLLSAARAGQAEGHAEV